MLLTPHSQKDIEELYQTYLHPRDYSRRHLGEVFTPLPIAQKLVDHIPPHVMNNPSSTFLDPAAGAGGFLIVLFKKLMFTLSTHIPDAKTRKHHIISKMLLAADISQRNINIMHKIFGKKLRIYHGDSRDLDLEKAFGLLQKASVVIGNPPFQATGKTTREGHRHMWMVFVRKSIQDWLQEGGYFAMLLPPSWRKPVVPNPRHEEVPLWELMTRECTPLWVNMYGTTILEGNVSIRYDLVILQKKQNHNTRTTIVDVDGKTSHHDLSLIPFLPNGNISYWKKMLHLRPTENKMVYSCFYHSNNQRGRVRRMADPQFRHKVVHAIHKDGTPVFLYSNQRKREGGFGVPKLIFNGYGAWNPPLLDWEGKYGMSEVVFGLPIASRAHGERMLGFFQKPKTLPRFRHDMTWAICRPTISWKLFYYLDPDFFEQ